MCFAYMLGHERKDFRANDNGEPWVLGKPILGQINSNELTDILIIVVRYFGGIKLGTSGLIVAYKATAAEAIAAADIVERTVDEEITVSFEYPFMNDIMRIVKRTSLPSWSNHMMDCLMRLGYVNPWWENSVHVWRRWKLPVLLNNSVGRRYFFGPYSLRSQQMRSIRNVAVKCIPHIKWNSL